MLGSTAPRPLAWGVVEPLARDIAGATAAHAALVSAVGGLTDAQVVAPSRLPGWTVGHVLTHLARNADSHTRMLVAARAGEEGVQYPGGAEQRASEIEHGAARPAAVMVADLAEACARLEHEWAALPASAWQGECLTGLGTAPVRELPVRRWRETAVHHADLGLAYTHRDWPGDYVRIDLQRATMLWASRRPMGLTALPAAALALDDRDRLAWLLGRVEVAGLDPAGIT